MESLQEISQYLNPNTRLDLKATALEHILSEYLLLKNVLLFQFYYFNLLILLISIMIIIILQV